MQEYILLLEPNEYKCDEVQNAVEFTMPKTDENSVQTLFKRLNWLDWYSNSCISYR